jgi:hypothetical protein
MRSPMSFLTPTGSALQAMVCWHPADLKLVWTKGHDKLGVGVTQESHKVPWYKFPMGGQDPCKHREGKADRDKGQGYGTREGACK